MYLILDENYQPSYLSKDIVNSNYLIIESNQLYDLLNATDITSNLIIDYSLSNKTITELFESVKNCFDHLLLYVDVNDNKL